MEGLSALFQNFAELFTPVIDFLIWSWPIKVSHLSDGQRGVILTLGKVRRKNAEKGPGLIFYFSFEEMHYTQALNNNADFPEQTILTQDGTVSVINGACIYDVLNVQKAIIETEGVEDLLIGICLNSIREYASIKTLEEMKDSRRLTQGLANKINRKLSDYGVKIKELFLADLRPHDIAMLCDTAKELFKK